MSSEPLQSVQSYDFRLANTRSMQTNNHKSTSLFAREQFRGNVKANDNDTNEPYGKTYLGTAKSSQVRNPKLTVPSGISIEHLSFKACT